MFNFPEESLKKINAEAQSKFEKLSLLVSSPDKEILLHCFVFCFSAARVASQIDNEIRANFKALFANQEREVISSFKDHGRELRCSQGTR